MRIDVEPMTLELAEVTLTPAWWRRLILRESTETMYAVRTIYGWCWDKPRRPITDRVIADALDRARIEALRIARSRNGDEPPS